MAVSPVSHGRRRPQTQLGGRATHGQDARAARSGLLQRATWRDGPNIAVGPAGYEALFKGFGSSPWVGLCYDPSHLQSQLMDPVQCARDFADKIWDVHLKDVEIMWHVLRKVGINPFRNVSWWRYRLPGHGQLNWAEFFTILQEAGYKGAMNIEHEDAFYYPAYEGDDFTPQYKEGFRVTHEFLRQFVPA